MASTPHRFAGVLSGIASMANVVAGEPKALALAISHLRQGWDFADALHHALSAGCEDFVSFDKILAKRSKRPGNVSPAVTLLA